MITRRGVLICGAATIGVHRARALSSEAQKEFCMDIDIKRNGSRPSQKGPGRLVHRDSPHRPAIPGSGSRSRGCWPGHVRARRPQQGGPIEEIRPGDVVWFPPGLRHWHGASPTNAMTHIAIQESVDGKAVDWMEKVSDEQYRK